MAPRSVNGDVALFCTTPVTLAPITALMDEPLEPVPELVMVPVLFTLAVETEMPLVIVLLLLLRIRLPVPVAPPERVRTAVVPLAAVLVSVVAVPFGVNAPEMVSGEVLELSVIVGTVAPTGALTLTIRGRLSAKPNL